MSRWSKADLKLTSAIRPSHTDESGRNSGDGNGTRPFSRGSNGAGEAHRELPAHGLSDLDQVRITVNGEERTHLIEPAVLLVDYLREIPGITSVKIGCDTSQCGTCTVLLGGLAVKSCTIFAIQADGSSVETAEGLSDDRPGCDLEAAFRESHATQCGFCAGGMIVAAEALLRLDVEPDEATVRRGLDGNLCRCSDYQAFIAAVQRVAVARGHHRGVRP